MDHIFFRYFYEISQIPRESGNEREISDYLVKFAKDRNLEVTQDKYYNVVIKKKATKGYENIPTVILQGHMDMVCVKEATSNHDFSKDPIKFNVINDMIYAKETTLGADDGISLAYALSILDSNNLQHPELEIVLTTEEESTMKGAIELDVSNLNGKIMINLDSDKDDKLLVSSTGGVVAMQNIDIKYDDIKEGYKIFELNVGGLMGGHSGDDIHRQRGNANKIMAKVLKVIKNKFNIQLASINGGNCSNAIPRQCVAHIYINVNDLEDIKNLLDKIEKEIKFEHRTTDKTLYIKLDEFSNKKYTNTFSKETLETLVSTIILIPNGVISMSNDIKGLVESSNNIGVIKTYKDKILIESEIRSCLKSKKLDIENIIKEVSKILNIKYTRRDEYSEWNYKEDSTIREVFKNSYKKLFNKELELDAVHAGLETGIFIEKMPYLDIVSYGPNAYDVHTPNEHLSISSSIRTFDLLVEVLKSLKDYY